MYLCSYIILSLAVAAAEVAAAVAAAPWTAVPVSEEKVSLLLRPVGWARLSGMLKPLTKRPAMSGPTTRTMKTKSMKK
jgi:hypothetical protein